ncbi:TIGR01777 family oxidoreductase [Rhodohalobacter mucosus]|uniref:TIGR01777 family protein n=1 Tax=Rhodohalobacter mucosus TaxID=2079485 RepID=A0A316TUC7_9BACT|nr:TIGR01777 family oxidoreductase [Rhodohalobacter mucosus]PWN08153.1 TIGR01777 family protein [Rhodohalobacter mucosus]
MDSKQILITGGTGFIGTHLSEILMRDGHYITIVTRSPEAHKNEEAKNQKFIPWDDLTSVMGSIDVVINMAGENLFGQRWTPEVKEKLYNSRILTTRKLVDAIRASVSKPEVFISTSGVNYYKDSGDDVITEESEPGDDFLANLCIDWEKEAELASDLGVRVVIARFGIVLEKNGGVIDKMRLPFKLFVGGPVGSGDQYMPWIHMEDLCHILIYAMENEELEGALNACSPEPVTMDEFADTLGDVMNRPSFFRVPEFVLDIVLGEAAVPVTGSLRVQPKVLQKSGFEFEYDDLGTALADIM